MDQNRNASQGLNEDGDRLNPNADRSDIERTRNDAPATRNRGEEGAGISNRGLDREREEQQEITARGCNKEEDRNA
mgnify:CR=1 FL=1